VHEFLAIVTHPRIYSPPTKLAAALAQMEAWLEAPGLVLLPETAEYWPVLRSFVEGGQVVGPQVHDARVAALCHVHGVRELWTADRDFSRFPGLTTRNPLHG
jgi:predicted nucleic acid-binding protein